MELYRLIESSRATIIGAGGSRGSAKSHGGRAIMLARRLKYPGTAGMIFRRKRKQHKGHLDAGYFKTWPDLRQWWRESKHTIQLPNGSAIYFGVAENPGDIEDFQGDEYMDVMIDEAARLTENELVKVNVCRRWTGRLGGKPIPDWMCKTWWLMNPGGPGHNFIRRVMFLKEYHDKERPEDYAFMQAHAWDNVEWARAALAQRNQTEDDYYSWSDEERFKFFIHNTQYGHELNSLPPRLRNGWLLGDWNDFAGQFYDIWDPARFVKRCKPERDWFPVWLGIDWGFQHPMSAHWMHQREKKTRIHRELLSNHHSARAQAQEIVDMTPGCEQPKNCGDPKNCRCPGNERRKVDAIYLSPDAFQERSEQDSFAEQMGEVFLRNGMPYPTPADDDRKHGAQAMYELMKADELEVDPTCKHLIDVIPMVCTEEDDPEEIEKFEGDDAWDSARYGIKSRAKPGKKPVSEVAQEKVEEYAKGRGVTVAELEPNTVASLSRRALAMAKQSRRRQGGRGRVWHPHA